MEISKPILAGPVLLSISIKIVNPDRLPRPTVPLKVVLSIWLLHIDIRKVVLRILRIVLLINTASVDRIRLVDTDVAILNQNHLPLLLGNLVVQLGDFAHGPRRLIEHEVLLRLRVLDIAPEHIDWEPVFGEVLIAFDQHLCRVVLPLAVVETKGVYARDRRIAGNFGEGLLDQFWGGGLEARAKDEKFHGAAFGGEAGMGAWP